MGKFIDLSRHSDSVKGNPIATLHTALQEGLQDVIVIGYDANGNRYYGSSIEDGPMALWLLEMTKKKLLEIGDPEPIFAPSEIG